MKTLNVSEEVFTRLTKHGKFGMTANELIIKILDEVEKK